MTDGNLTYAGSGVSYDALDRFKRMAQEAAGNTSRNIDRLGIEAMAASRGESAFLVELPGHFLAHVEEGLGTKNMVVEHLEIPNERTELSINPRFWANIAQDAVAMIVNDMITLGALPISVAMHLAVGDSSWFDYLPRAERLIEGWERACTLARCTWGGGETPTLQGVVVPGTMVLSGSAVGIIEPKEHLIQGNIQDGDTIVMLASSGIHANGLTLARQIAEKVGYLEHLSDNRYFAEALLDPTPIYVPVVEDVLDAGIRPHYAVNITGHGWRKLMRAVEPFVYVIENVPMPHSVFRFIEERGPVTEEEMYATYNMGAGFALYIDPQDADKVVRISGMHGIKAWKAGHIEKRSDERAVVIEPKGITFNEGSLEVR